MRFSDKVRLRAKNILDGALEGARSRVVTDYLESPDGKKTVTVAKNRVISDQLMDPGTWVVIIGAIAGLTALLFAASRG